MTELYKFEGSITYGFTSSILSKTFEALTYAPTLVKRSAINIEHNFAKNNVTFTFARNHFYARELLTEVPETPVLVTIYRTDGVSYSTYWQGRVVGAKGKGITIDVICDSIYSTLRRGGISPKVTLFCRHALYGAMCGVSQGLWGVNYSVTVTSTEIFVSGLSQPAGYFNNGIAVMNSQQRRIITNSATHIHLSAPFNFTGPGTITLYPGCELTQIACDGFSNSDRFGGFDHLPTKNPFNSSGLL